MSQAISYIHSSPTHTHGQHILISDIRRLRLVGDLKPLESTPGIISLLYGKPNQSTFPIGEISITLRPPSAPQPCSPTEEPVCETLTLRGNELAVGLQYCLTDGIPEFRSLLGEFQTLEHGVIVDNVTAQLTVGNGGQDLIYKAFMCLLDPGDSLLIEAPTYT